jgi:hypothetical protein
MVGIGGGPRKAFKIAYDLPRGYGLVLVFDYSPGGVGSGIEGTFLCARVRVPQRDDLLIPAQPER